MASISMSRLMSVTAETKRPPALASGKRGAAVTELVKVRCLPLDPVSVSEMTDRVARMGLDSPIALYQTVVSGSLDIVAGDILVVDDVEYPIRDVEPWAESSLGNDSYKRLIVEKVKP
jgi:hypothetical protein